MSTNTLNNRSSGETILDTFFNDIHTALNGDFVGRNSTGVPTSGQNLGTTAFPWGTIRGSSLILNGSAVDTSTIVSPQNRVVSGAERATSNQPAFIIPNGAAPSFVIDGTPTNLVFDVNGTAVTVTTDITKSSLTLAPSTNNTALVNDATAADQAATRTYGESTSSFVITIDTVGSEITALVGKWAAFKIEGVSTEYFLAFVNSATQLTKCFRGFFFNSSLAPINRTAFSNNDTITLMSLAWIFIENNATTVDVTYNNPTWSFTAPSSPATGDYWYDFANDLWKRYDGASFQIINRTFVGMAIIDTANCVGARCVDFHANYQQTNFVDVELSTTSIVRTVGAEARVSVAGNEIRFRNSLAFWNITTDLASSADMYNATEQASTLYYLYLTDQGETVISDIEPYWRADLYGYYHPHNPWRAVGTAYNNSSSDLTTVHATGISASRTHRWISYDPTFSATFGTVSNFDFRYRIIGDSLDIRGFLAVGTIAGGVMTFSLPGGLNIDIRKLPGGAGANRAKLGTASATATPSDPVAFSKADIYYSAGVADTTLLAITARVTTTQYKDDAAGAFVSSTDFVFLEASGIPIFGWNE